LSLLSSFFSFNFLLFLEATIVLFAILDPIGTVPIFLSITEEFSEERKKIVKQSVILSAIILYVFAYLGWIIFDILGITLNDFRIAGGIVLFTVAYDHLRGHQEGARKQDAGEVAAFPLATPLLAGPGAISTVIIFANPPYGPLVTFLVITINAALTYMVLSESVLVQRVFGPNGTKVLTRITALLIAALAVSFVREGIVNVIMSLK